MKPMVRDRDRGKREAALVHGRQVITIMRMDVFIMGCVSHSYPSLPLFLPPSLYSSLAHLSSSVCILHLADRDLISTPLPHCYSFSQEAGLFGCACVYVPPSSSSTTQSHPSTFVAKARCSYGGGSNGVWNLGMRKRATPRFSAFSDRAPGDNPLSPLPLHSQTLLYFPVVFSLPCLRGQGERNPIFRAPSFTHPCAHPSICPSTFESQTARFPPQVIASVED